VRGRLSSPAVRVEERDEAAKDTKAIKERSYKRAVHNVLEVSVVEKGRVQLLILPFPFDKAISDQSNNAYEAPYRIAYGASWAAKQLNAGILLELFHLQRRTGRAKVWDSSNGRRVASEQLLN